ncbi:MAG: signal peptidase I [Brevinemataceae bacterium]
MSNKQSNNNSSKKEKFIENVKLFFSTYVLALLIRTLVIEASQIPSQSMVPNLIVGDILMVEKLSLGPYLPVINKKFPNFTNPNVNNMVVFVSPEWVSPSFGDELITFLTLSLVNKDNTFANPKILVKRVVAGPGDVLAMTNMSLYRNGISLNNGVVDSQNQILYSHGRRQGVMSYKIFQEKEEQYQRLIQHLDDVLSLPATSNVAFENKNFNEEIRTLLIQGFPEVRIPQKGVEIDIQKLNYYERYLLALLITRETGIRTGYQDGNIVQNNQILSKWIPNDDYYFMMGDNRDFSEDSRYFGFVPRQKIYGRILFRYWPLTRATFNVNLKTKDIKKK